MLSAMLLAALPGASSRLVEQVVTGEAPFEPLTVYHVNPASYKPTPLNMDTGDTIGDMYFDMRTMALPLECAHNPKSADCANAEVVANDLVITKLTLEVRRPLGPYGMCNVCVNGTDHHGNNSCADGAYWCTCGGKQCSPRVGTENVSHAHPTSCAWWSQQYECWRAKSALKFPGLWYSTTSAGWCGNDSASPRSGCTWRVKEVVKIVNKTCSNGMVFAAVEAAGAQCFATCKDSGVGNHGRNTTSPCWIGCLYATVLGPDAGHHGGAIAGMPLEVLRAAWDRPFLAVEDGGCPALPVPAEVVGSPREQSMPLSNGARWHGFPGFAVGSTNVAATPGSSPGVHSLHLRSHTIHSQPRSRIHSLLTNGSSIPAGGAVWPTAIYWSFVEVGTPPVSFPVAIDSGSGDLDIAGVGCDGCVTTPPNKAYSAEASSTSSATFPYKFSNSYQTCDLKDPTAPCTISGKLYKDQVSLAGAGPVSVKFGSITGQTTNFDQFKQIDGVMGFTMGGDENVFAQLVAAKLVDNVWALCMKAGSKSNGTLTIGGVDPRLVDGAVQYVPDAGRGFHSVSVKSLSLGGANSSAASIDVDEAAILDTGTNVLLLPSKLMTALQAAMCADASLARCTALWANKCVALSDAEVAAYPPLALQLDAGVSLLMSSADYLLRGSPLATQPGQYCLGIRDGGHAGGSGFIIGDTTMRNYYLVFDLAEQRIGWGNVSTVGCGSVGEGKIEERPLVEAS